MEVRRWRGAEALVGTRGGKAAQERNTLTTQYGWQSILHINAVNMLPYTYKTKTGARMHARHLPSVSTSDSQHTVTTATAAAAADWSLLIPLTNMMTQQSSFHGYILLYVSFVAHWLCLHDQLSSQNPCWTRQWHGRPQAWARGGTCPPLQML